MKNFIIGIDVSKDTLDFCILEKDNRKKFMQGVIANKEKDILTWLKKFDKEQFIVAIEHTGHYGAQADISRNLSLNRFKAYGLSLKAYCVVRVNECLIKFVL